MDTAAPVVGQPHGLTGRRPASMDRVALWLLGVVYLLALAVSAFRWHYGPDTRFYLAWAYRFGGLSEQESGRRSYEFLNHFGWFSPYGQDTSDPNLTYDWLFRGAQGGLVAQRPVYPLLSAPFVTVLGPPGLLVVPLLAFTAALVMVVVLGHRLLGPRWAAPAGVVFLLPVSIVHFGLYAYTEALALALLLGCVLCLPWGSARGRRSVVVFAVALLLFAFTRQFHYALVLGVALAWLGVAVRDRRARNPWAPFAVVGVAVAAGAGAVQALMAPGYSVLTPFLAVSGAGTVGGIPGALPGVLARIAAGEARTAGHDFGLVLVVALGLVGLVLGIRSELAWLTLGLLLGILALQVLTALPSENRYWALAVPLLALHATGLVRRVFTGPPPGRDLGHSNVLEDP